MRGIKKQAADVLDTAREGIGWIAVWKIENSWYCMGFWPDYTEGGAFEFCDFEKEQLTNIAKHDKDAILVNGYYCNLGDPETMTVESLARALLWQYDNSTYKISDILEAQR